MRKGSIYFIVFVLVMAMFFGVYSITYSQTKTKLLPLAVSAIMFILGVAQLVDELNKKKIAQENNGPEEVGRKKDQSSKLLPHVIYFAWLLGLIFGIYILGFIISIPIFIFCFLLLHGENWYKSVSTAAITTIILHVVFVLIFKFNLYEGKFFSMLS